MILIIELFDRKLEVKIMYTTHFKMNEQEVIDYLKAKQLFFTAQENKLIAKEIGDGNMNYVYRVTDQGSGRSVIVKQADKYTRSSRKIGQERNKIEFELLCFEAEKCPDMVPQIFHYDEIMTCIVMEDLKAYQNMRFALMEEKSFPFFSQKIVEFIIKTIVSTMDSFVGPMFKRKQVQKYTNVDACDITERLVLTNPYREKYAQAPIEEVNLPYLYNHFQMDQQLLLEAAKLKYKFKNETQALLHGDLHSGSIFINQTGMKIIDPEFACYAPIGYDIGNVIANLFFAHIRSYVLNPGSEQSKYFRQWIENTVMGIITDFTKKFLLYFQENVTDAMEKSQDYRQWLLHLILEDTAGYAGLEINRRIIGIAKVKDIESIQDKNQKALAERILLMLGRNLIVNRTQIKAAENYTAALAEACALAEREMK